MRWAGVNLWGWRFASVLPAACVVFPLYLLTRELFVRRTAIAANVMMIANQYFLAFARLGYNNIQALFPVTFCIYFLILGLRRNNRFYLWLAGLAAGLGFYTYFAAWLGLVVAILIPLAFALVTRQKFQKCLSSLLIIITAAFVVFSPRIIYGLSGDSDKSLSYKVWETGPINQIEDGQRYTLNVAQRTRPVAQYLALQRRYRHMSAEDSQRLQAEVDEGWARLQHRVAASALA